MTRIHAVGAALVGLAALCPPVAAQKGPAVADVLRAGTEYLAAYARAVSGVTLEEEYTMLDVSSGRVAGTQRLASDVVLLDLAGKVIALRDAFAIDNNALRERTPRITTLLAAPTLAKWERAQAYAAESYRHMQADLIARVNEPTQALLFLAGENQSRVRYRIDGRRRMDGVEVVGLRFDEPETRNDPSYVIKTSGNAVASGRLWIDASTGAVHQTELSLRSQTESAHVAVTYAHDSTLDLWLPSTMVDRYEMTIPTGAVSNMGGGANNVRRSFDCRARYSNPRLTPIVLAVPR